MVGSINLGWKCALLGRFAHDPRPTSLSPTNEQDQDLKRYMDSCKTGLDPTLVKV